MTIQFLKICLVGIGFGLICFEQEQVVMNNTNNSLSLLMNLIVTM